MKKRRTDRIIEKWALKGSSIELCIQNSAHPTHIQKFIATLLLNGHTVSSDMLYNIYFLTHEHFKKSNLFVFREDIGNLNQWTIM